MINIILYDVEIENDGLHSDYYVYTYIQTYDDKCMN